jgi:hypothetical protein
MIRRLRELAVAYWPQMVFTVVFAVSRMIYRGEYGVRFDGSPLFYFIQYVDPWFFEHDFLRTILHLTQQAPLPNLVIGLAWLTFGPSYWTVAMDVVFLAFGLTLGYSLLSALESLGVRRAVAVLFVCPFLVTPVAVIYETWLFYHVPVAALLAAALAALLRYYRTGTLLAGLTFFSLLALVALIRNVYGALWLGAVAAGVFLIPPLCGPNGKRARVLVLKAAAIPLLLVIANNAKTSLLVGRGFGDAAIWTNIVWKTWERIAEGERNRLKAAGAVSDSVEYEPFQGLEQLEGMRVALPPTGVPILDLERTPNMRDNVHALEYLVIAEKYYKPDGKFLLRSHPQAYAASVRFALFDWYLSSPSRDIVLPRLRNAKKLKKLDRRMNRLLGKHPGGRLQALVIGVPAMLAYAIYRLLRPRAMLASERSTVAAVLFMLLTISYAAIGTTLISYADFSRYRFDVDPFYLVFLVLAVSQAGGWVRGQWRSVRSVRAVVSAP